MNVNKIVKFGLWGLAGTISLLGLATVVYVFGHKPDVVSEPCFRSRHRADGRPKKAFNTPQAANWQSVKQLVRYGEVCNSYQVDDEYYTGHSKNAFRRNIYRSAS